MSEAKKLNSKQATMEVAMAGNEKHDYTALDLALGDIFAIGTTPGFRHACRLGAGPASFSGVHRETADDHEVGYACAAIIKKDVDDGNLYTGYDKEPFAPDVMRNRYNESDIHSVVFVQAKQNAESLDVPGSEEKYDIRPGLAFDAGYVGAERAYQAGGLKAVTYAMPERAREFEILHDKDGLQEILKAAPDRAKEITELYQKGGAEAVMKAMSGLGKAYASIPESQKDIRNICLSNAVPTDSNGKPLISHCVFTGEAQWQFDHKELLESAPSDEFPAASGTDVPPPPATPPAPPAPKPVAQASTVRVN